MKAITIRGIDEAVSKKLKQTAKTKGKSINQLILELIRQNVGMQKKKKFNRQYDDLDHLFGKWSDAEFKKMKGMLDNQRKIDPELWR